MGNDVLDTLLSQVHELLGVCRLFVDGDALMLRSVVANGLRRFASRLVFGSSLLLDPFVALGGKRRLRTFDDVVVLLCTRLLLPLTLPLSYATPKTKHTPTRHTRIKKCELLIVLNSRFSRLPIVHTA